MSGLIPALRHSKGLLCLHMASNPGINSAVIEYYVERLKIQSEEQVKMKVQHEYLGPLSEEDEARLSPRSLKIRNHKAKH